VFKKGSCSNWPLLLIVLLSWGFCNVTLIDFLGFF